MMSTVLAELNTGLHPLPLVALKGPMVAERALRSGDEAHARWDRSKKMAQLPAVSEANSRLHSSITQGTSGPRWQSRAAVAACLCSSWATCDILIGSRQHVSKMPRCPHNDTIEVLFGFCASCHAESIPNLLPCTVHYSGIILIPARTIIMLRDDGKAP